MHGEPLYICEVIINKWKVEVEQLIGIGQSPLNKLINSIINRDGLCI